MTKRLHSDKLDVSLTPGIFQSRIKYFKNGPGKEENIHTSEKYLITLLKGVVI